jgi:hypothetical protein
MGYLANLWNALHGLGDSFDEAENAALGGPANETISIRVAKAEADGKRWGCWACAALSWLVQYRHCQRQLQALPMGVQDYIRAFVWLSIWIWLPVSWHFLGLFWSIWIVFMAFMTSIFVTFLEVG